MSRFWNFVIAIAEGLREHRGYYAGQNGGQK
jgi:hypothetical protein